MSVAIAKDHHWTCRRIRRRRAAAERERDTQKMLGDLLSSCCTVTYKIELCEHFCWPKWQATTVASRQVAEKTDSGKLPKLGDAKDTYLYRLVSISFGPNRPTEVLSSLLFSLFFLLYQTERRKSELENTSLQSRACIENLTDEALLTKGGGFAASMLKP